MVGRLREATGAAHERLDTGLKAVDRLADPGRRSDLLRRYADFYLPADDALAGHLGDVGDLDFEARRRGPLMVGLAGPGSPPDFPRPSSAAEAFGMFYVLEGSSLGGRMILRELTRRGVDDPNLRFLDPYGAQTGARWRSFLDVLEREVGTGGEPAAAAAEMGAVRGFDHAERVLCEARA